MQCLVCYIDGMVQFLRSKQASQRLVVHGSILVSTNFAEYLHALQHLLLEIRARDVLARESAIRSIKLERLDRFPNTMYLRRWQRNH